MKMEEDEDVMNVDGAGRDFVAIEFRVTTWERACSCLGNSCSRDSCCPI